MNIRKLLLILLCLLASPALWPEPALAQKSQKSQKSQKKPALDLENVRKLLKSSEEEQVLSGLELIAKNPEPAAAPLVEELLKAGSSLKALLSAIEVAKTLAQASSSPILAAYVQHRTPDLRRAAAKALISTKGPTAVSALRAALRRNDPELRSIAASGLGSLAAKEAVPDLFLVLSREVPDAASSIGELCSLSECEKFVGYIGRLPFDVMQSGLEPILFRSAHDIPDDFKLSLIERIRKLQTESASELLKTVLARFPEDGSPKVKAALEVAVRNRTRAESGK